MDRVQICTTFPLFSSDFGRGFVWKLSQASIWDESFLWVSSEFGRGFVWKSVQRPFNSRLAKISHGRFRAHGHLPQIKRPCDISKKHANLTDLLIFLKYHTDLWPHGFSQRSVWSSVRVVLNNFRNAVQGVFHPCI